MERRGPRGLNPRPWLTGLDSTEEDYKFNRRHSSTSGGGAAAAATGQDWVNSDGGRGPNATDNELAPNSESELSRRRPVRAPRNWSWRLPAELIADDNRPEFETGGLQSFSQSGGVHKGTPGDAKCVAEIFWTGTKIKEVGGGKHSQNVGCMYNLVNASIVLYADDILLLSPSVCSLQQLLSACEAKLRQLDLAINIKKSVCQSWTSLSL